MLAIYGANASGKSNIVNAFLNFQQVLSHGVGGRYFGNKLNAKYDYSSFTVLVSFNGRRFRYKIAYDGEKIRLEELFELFQGKEARVFSIGQTNDSKDKAVNAFDGLLRTVDVFCSCCRIVRGSTEVIQAEVGRCGESELIGFGGEHLKLQTCHST